MADAAVLLTVTLTCEPGFVATIEALGARVGQHAGCGPDEAQRLGRAIGRALGGIVAQGTPPAPSEVDISFIGNGRVLRVDVSCPAADGGDAFSLERAVSDTGALAAIQALVDRVEFGREGARQYCRLTRQLRAGHRLDEPPGHRK